jgi:hypothetical protein
MIDMIDTTNEETSNMALRCFMYLYVMFQIEDTSFALLICDANDLWYLHSVKLPVDG